MKLRARILVLAVALGSSVAMESHIAHADEFEETHPQVQPVPSDHVPRFSEDAERREGTVAWFDPHRGFGGIVTDDGHDVFLHVSAVDRRVRTTLSEGMRVSFELVTGPVGLAALHVRPVP